MSGSSWSVVGGPVHLHAIRGSRADSSLSPVSALIRRLCGRTSWGGLALHEQGGPLDRRPCAVRGGRRRRRLRADAGRRHGRAGAPVPRRRCLGAAPCALVRRDPDRITISGPLGGRSSGGDGHGGRLAGLRGPTGRCRQRAAAASAGCTIWSPSGSATLNDVLGLTAEVARRNSPVHLPPLRAGSLVLARGGEERKGPSTTARPRASRRQGAPRKVPSRSWIWRATTISRSSPSWSRRRRRWPAPSVA